MKLILTILVFTNLAFASYTIKYHGLELGTIDNFDTLKDNYLQANVTSKIAKFLLRKDKFVFYNVSALHCYCCCFGKQNEGKCRNY